MSTQNIVLLPCRRWGVRVKNPWQAFVAEVMEILGALVICMVAQLLIWVVSLTPTSPVPMNSLASTVGMLVVFAFMGICQTITDKTMTVYTTYIKSKVDLINRHLGVGFCIPLVMVGVREDMVPSGRDIGLAIAVFGEGIIYIPILVTTTAIFWLVTLGLSWILAYALIIGTNRFCLASCGNLLQNSKSDDAVAPEPLALHEIRSRHSDCEPREVGNESSRARARARAQENLPLSGGTKTSEVACPTSSTTLVRQPKSRSESSVDTTFLFSTALATTCLLLVAIPISASLGDDRALDGCVVWLAWTASLKTQSYVRTASGNSVWILVNPVILATAILVGYTRAQKALWHKELPQVLGHFSGGVPVQRLWSYGASQTPLDPDQAHWFGAGDVALALLQWGMVAWGFKLYEYRRQICSMAGCVVVLASVAASVASSFISVFLAKAIGLQETGALAFAARSTTLALARPATQTLGGNTVINAAAVVFSGIVGQLVTPYLLRRLHVAESDTVEGSGQGQGDTDGGDVKSEHLDLDASTSRTQRRLAAKQARNMSATISAGTAIGANGIAMGVSYLYEKRSQCAPYAALAMTIFGATTLIVTEVFKGALQTLAQRQ